MEQVAAVAGQARVVGAGLTAGDIERVTLQRMAGAGAVDADLDAAARW